MSATEWTTHHGETLAWPDVLDLAEIITAGRRFARVARVLDSGDVISGTARGIYTETDYLANARCDVRGTRLRITTLIGAEVFMPMHEVITKYRAGELTLQDPI